MRSIYDKGIHGEFETVFKGNFFASSYKTNANIDPGGDGGYPSRLTLYIEQMQDVAIDKHGSTVTMDFVGSQEFFEFHQAMALLVRDLNTAFGDPLAKGGAS